jgi:hypothetical protein
VDGRSLPVDDLPATVDERHGERAIAPWTDGGHTVDAAPVRWKHNGVVPGPGENPTSHPQEVHPTEPRPDLRRSGMVHRFHTPYYGDGMYLRNPSLQYGVWVTTREERQ